VLRIERLLPRGSPPPRADFSLTLPFALRQKSRLLVRLDEGGEAGLFLPRGTVLADGDRLVAADGRIVRVLAAREDVYEVRPTAECSLVQAAYHLGNRHVRVEIGDSSLKLERDPVLREMLEQLGAAVDETRATFHPEPGAYGGGHRHGSGDGEAEEFALAQSVFALRHGSQQ
jgi:urease accessory protein